MSDQLNRLMQMLNSDPSMQMRNSFLKNIKEEQALRGYTPFYQMMYGEQNMPSNMVNNDIAYANQLRNTGMIPPFETVYEQGDINPMNIANTQSQYMQYLNSILNNTNAPRMGTEDTMGRIRAAQELQRLKGLI